MVRQASCSSCSLLSHILPSQLPVHVNMLRSVVCLWLLAVLTAGQFQQDFDTTITRPLTTVTISDGRQISPTSTSSTQLGEQGVGQSTVDQEATIASSTTGTALQGGSNQHVSTSGVTVEPTTIPSSTTFGASAPIVSSQSTTAAEHTSSGSSTNKVAIGVGVGVGIPVVAGALALLFLLRRRRSSRDRYGSSRSAASYREQPAMSSGAPALAGMSDMGRSPSKHSLPHTPSQHSLATMPPPPPGPEHKIMPPPQHSFSIERAPTQHSITPSLAEQHTLMSPPPAYDYDDAPSPMDEHPEPVSPVSPISPADSRPPSPMHDHER